MKMKFGKVLFLSGAISSVLAFADYPSGVGGDKYGYYPGGNATQSGGKSLKDAAGVTIGVSAFAWKTYQGGCAVITGDKDTSHLGALMPTFTAYDWDYMLDYGADSNYNIAAYRFGDLESTESSSTVSTSSTKRIYDPNMKFGFKVCAAFDTGHDDFKLSATYTWFRAKEEGEEVSGDLYCTLPLTASPFLRASKLVSDWEFHLNVIDFELSRTAALSPYFTITPMVGIKGMWDKNESTKLFTSDSNVKFLIARGNYLGRKAKDDTESITHIKADTIKDYKYLESCAIGPKFSSKCKWGMTPSFGLVGYLSASPLWTNNHKATEEVTAYNASDNDNSDSNDNKHKLLNLDANHEKTAKLVFEGRLGLEYSESFDDDGYSIAANLSFEAQEWKGFAKSAVPEPFVQNSDRSFCGVTFSIAFGF